MADFPSKVNTETSSPQAQGSQQGGNSLRGLAADVTSKMDMSFIRSIPAILMIAEIVLGLIQWALIATGYHAQSPAFGWVLFVAITFWILTTILFFMILCGGLRKLPSVPWSLTVMVYNAVATILYLTAFLTNAIAANRLRFYFDHMAAAAFFGAVVTVAYAASTVFSYLTWKGEGGDATTSTVPT